MVFSGIKPRLSTWTHKTKWFSFPGLRWFPSNMLSVTLSVFVHLITSNPSESLNLCNLTQLTLKVTIPQGIWFCNTVRRVATWRQPGAWTSFLVRSGPLHRPCPRRNTEQPEAKLQVRGHLKQPDPPLGEAMLTSKRMTLLGLCYERVGETSSVHYRRLCICWVCKPHANVVCKQIVDQSDRRLQASWAVNPPMLSARRLHDITHLIQVTHLLNLLICSFREVLHRPRVRTLTAWIAIILTVLSV